MIDAVNCITISVFCSNDIRFPLNLPDNVSIILNLVIYIAGKDPARSVVKIKSRTIYK